MRQPQSSAVPSVSDQKWTAVSGCQTNPANLHQSTAVPSVSDQKWTAVSGCLKQIPQIPPKNGESPFTANMYVDKRSWVTNFQLNRQRS